MTHSRTFWTIPRGRWKSCTAWTRIASHDWRQCTALCFCSSGLVKRMSVQRLTLATSRIFSSLARFDFFLFLSLLLYYYYIFFFLRTFDFSSSFSLLFSDQVLCFFVFFIVSTRSKQGFFSLCSESRLQCMRHFNFFFKTWACLCSRESLYFLSMELSCAELFYV